MSAGIGGVHRTLRLVFSALHLLRGLVTIALVHPLASPETRLAQKRRWSRRLLEIYGVRIEQRGASPAPGSLLVANHISWLDVFAINAVQPAAFVAKAEVRGWPVIGWLAARAGTIFLRRGSRGHARVINEEIAAVLGRGANVAVFPEGTTTDGSHVLHFHGALLQPAIAAGHPVQPVAIAYRDASGLRTDVAAYVGDMSLLESMRNIAGAPALTVEVWIGEPLSGDVAHRRELAAAARETIARQLGIELQSQPAGAT